MHLGMQGLHSPVQHLREAGQFANVLDRETRRTQCSGRSAGRDQFHSKARQGQSELHQAGLVRYAQQRPTNPFFRAQIPLLERSVQLDMNKARNGRVS